MRQLAGKVTNAPKWHTLEAEKRKTPHKSQDIKGLQTQAADKLRQHFFFYVFLVSTLLNISGVLVW